MSRLSIIAARAAALVSLAMLGWRAFQPMPEVGSLVTEVTLWTAGADGADTSTGRHLALPDALNAPARAERVPDVAYVRRAFPDLQRIAIAGNGIEPSDTALFAGLDVSWRRPVEALPSAPEIVAASAPRTLVVGQRLTVQGRLRGSGPDRGVVLSLESPDGTKQASEVRTSAEDSATFSLSSELAAVAPGAFEWTLRIGPDGEPWVFGVDVVPPDLPRVLLLQAAPTIEGGRLQRWLAESGAAVTSRTRVSADHVRFVAAEGSVTEFAQIEPRLLGAIDVVVAREAALLELSVNESDALERAIRETGVGLIVMGDPGPAAVPAFSPWRFNANNSNEDSAGRRMARLRLNDGTELTEPVTVALSEIVSSPLGRWLVRDPQERILAAAVPRGQGWMARTLVLDTWRWLQGGHADVFAKYWSDLLSAVARPAATTEGRWILDNASGPIAANQMLRLVWVGAPSGPFPDVEIRSVAQSGAAPVRLTLARDPRDESRALALHWPAQAGWHQVRTLPAGPRMAFYVQSTGPSQELTAERRRDTTARLVGERSSTIETAPKSEQVANTESARHTLISSAWFALFVVSTSWLWWSQRR